MEYRPLGTSGLKVSALGLGTNAFGSRADRATSIEVLHRALDAGVTLVDTANIYSSTASETIIGEGLKGRRDEAVLATKAGMKTGPGPNDTGSSRHHLMRELERSLRRLQTDYVDLYQIHRFDDASPLEETLRALDDMVRSGKVRYIGASNYAAWQLCKALWVSDRRGFARFDSIQPSYSLADRTAEQELVPLCLDQGVGLIAYYPLAGGTLTGKYRQGEAPPPGSRAVKTPRIKEQLLDPDRLALAEGVGSIAQRVGCSPAQLALAWLLRRPSVSSAIAGVTSPAQLEENLGAVELAADGALGGDVLRELDELSRPFIHRPF